MSSSALRLRDRQHFSEDASPNIQHISIQSSDTHLTEFVAGYIARNATLNNVGGLRARLDDVMYFRGVVCRRGTALRLVEKIENILSERFSKELPPRSLMKLLVLMRTRLTHSFGNINLVDSLTMKALCF